MAEGEGRPGAREVEDAVEQGWLRVVAPVDHKLVVLLQRDLDDGEAEAIALAVEQNPDVVLLDESEGRSISETFSLPRVGVVGLLIRAKREGRITSLKTELDCLRNEAGFWIRNELYLKALAAVGE